MRNFSFNYCLIRKPSDKTVGLRRSSNFQIDVDVKGRRFYTLSVGQTVKLALEVCFQKIQFKIVWFS